MGLLMSLCFVIFLFHSQVINCSSSFSSNSSSTQLCHHDQSFALLHFMEIISFNDSDASSFCDESYPKMVSWKEGSDCCSWDGVTCHKVTGHVIGLDLSCSRLRGTLHSNSTLFRLPHLQWLNLAHNDFSFSPISSGFGQFSSLRHLNLSSSRFSGHIPSELSHLSKLVSLDLSCKKCELETLSLTRLVLNLTQLQHLFLTRVDMSSVKLPSSFLNLSSSLTSLSLESCGLQGNFPNYIFNLPNLQTIRLHDNNLLTGSFPINFNRSSPLKILDLSHSNFSGEIPNSVGNLKSLNYLDLSNSNFSGEIPNSIGNLMSLNYLDLAGSNFAGEVPNSIGNLLSLNYLDLAGSNFAGEIPNSIGNLLSLNYLDLAGSNFAGEVPNSIGNLMSLNYLGLSNSNFSGEIPNSVGNLKSLNNLDLSNSNFSGEIPNSVGNLKSLNYLDLWYCNFSGTIPASLGNLTHITELYLHYNHFTGDIPSSLSNLVQLNSLDLSSNNLTGDIPSSLSNLVQLNYLDLSSNKFTRFSFSPLNMTRLVHLDLSDNELAGPIPASQLITSSQVLLPNLQRLNLSNNSLNGTIPSWVFALPSLTDLDLSYNHLSSHIPEFQYNDSLNSVYLNNNMLQGPIPSSIFRLVNLTYLSLSWNKLSGLVEAHEFINLQNLEYLYLSGNGLSWSTKSSNLSFTLPQLYVLHLSYCNVSEFPNFLEGSERLEVLDLSNNKIYGGIPNWVWDMGKDSLYYLNLSSNFLTSVLKLPWNHLGIIDLHSNLLQGPLPVPPLFTEVFSISNNKLTGKIPSSICNVNFLSVLNLSNNSLSGVIPKCLGNFSNQFSVLDLRMNNFSGTMPRTFAKGNTLRNLAFSGNQLEGPVPQSLINCTKLEVLDLGNNKINDTFPNWLDTLPKLRVLVLRSNKFHGFIGDSKTRFPFPELRIIDLSHNELTGVLPMEYFKNMKAMMNVDEGKIEQRYMGEQYYQDSVMVTMKGLEIELVKIQTIFTTIDLSSNKFQGEIPKSIGNLNSLRVFNLSHNNLTGQIPPSLGNSKMLESLDLSSNKLDGVIPSQLTSLTFLAVLNLSHNHLEGSIPNGKQFGTFDNNSYVGNSRLCGFPLSKKCGDDEVPPLIQKEDNSEFGGGFGWKAVLMGYGSGMVIGLAWGYHTFLTRNPEWILRIVERVQHKKIKRSNKSAARGRGGRRN